MTKFGPGGGGCAKIGGNCAIRAWQMGRNALHRAKGVPALVCRRAFARSKENMPVGTLFLLGILRDFSERSRSRSRIFPGASTTSGGFRKCVLSETAGAVSRLDVSRLHRRGRPFWGGQPCDRFEPRVLGAAQVALDGQDLSSAVLPAFVHR